MSTRDIYGATWIDPEEYAYPAGSLRQSRRHFAARCPDGKIRRGVCGVPDTFFSLPARLKANGKTVAGFVCIDTEREELTFRPYLYRANHDAFTKRVPFPHGIGCACCRAALVCNECGAALVARPGLAPERCTNGRCYACCRRVCNHREH